jgi:hypothetical protein
VPAAGSWGKKVMLLLRCGCQFLQSGVLSNNAICEIMSRFNVLGHLNHVGLLFQSVFDKTCCTKLLLRGMVVF